MVFMPATLARLMRFGAFGAAGFVLNIAVTVTLTEVFGAPEELAFALGLVMVFTFSFVTGRYLIFADAVQGDPRKQLAKFTLSSAAFRGTEYLGFLLLHTVLGFPYLVAIVLVLGVSFLTKFFTYSTVVFTADREAE